MKRFKVVAISIILQSLLINTISAHTLPENDIHNNVEWLNLLHHNKGKSVINSDSTFFLSKDGYKDAKAEYIATVETLLNKNNKAFCEYPARANFLIYSLGLNQKYFDFSQCNDYQEYLKKVPFDKVYIVFAAENNQSPSSMLGHTFLKIKGKDKNGIIREHSFSYFAALDNSNSLKFYIDIMTVGLDGAYILSPYQIKADEYLFGEKRSLWEFELNLSPEEKERLKQHLWELKGKKIRYKFITHNCNTALMNILKVANKDFSMKTGKPFITPVEYIQDLQQRDKFSDITIEPSVSQKNVIEKFGLNYIGNAPKPTRFSLNQDISNAITNINFSPVYQDIRDISNAYFSDLESKILDISFNYQDHKKQFVVDKIDLLKMMAVIDYPTSDSYSKYFRLGFENNLFSENTELNPVIEFGLGMGKKVSSTTFYILPKIGYHYHNFSNFYLLPQIGTITRISDKAKIINSYERYFNSKKDNKGFEERYNLYFGYKIKNDTELYIDYSHYSKAKHSESLSLGIALHF